MLPRKVSSAKHRQFIHFINIIKAYDAGLRFPRRPGRSKHKYIIEVRKTQPAAVPQRAAKHSDLRPTCQLHSVCYREQGRDQDLPELSGLRTKPLTQKEDARKDILFLFCLTCNRGQAACRLHRVAAVQWLPQLLHPLLYLLLVLQLAY